MGEPNFAGAEFPKGTAIGHLFAAGFLIGGIVGIDTLVSNTYDTWTLANQELYPDAEPNGVMRHYSTIDPSSPDFSGAFSEEDFEGICADTFTSGLYGLFPDYFLSRPHIPLGVQLTVRSLAWSPPYIDGCIFFKCRIRNIGEKQIEQAYVGLTASSSVNFAFSPDKNAADDLCGFLPTFASTSSCGFIDTLNLAWLADNDGDPISGRYSTAGHDEKSVTSVAGFELLGNNEQDTPLSFNWWTSAFNPLYDFGPRQRPTAVHPFRDFHTGGLGNPQGDVNKYYVLSNREIDYDQARTGQIAVNDPQWLTPLPATASAVSLGGPSSPVSILLSVGPYSLDPGEEVAFAAVFIAAENFHTDPENFENLKAGRVDEYYRNLNFAPLAQSARWAQWVYDNPGLDTDGDGYAGEQRICVFDSALIDGQWVATAAETTWYKGDGIPDWRAVLPPPAPTFWFEPVQNGIRVRFNGQASERTKDLFTSLLDFEGYRVYIGRDEREASLSVAASYDRRNYNKWVYREYANGTSGYEIEDVPMTLEQVRCRYSAAPDPCADSSFDPLAFSFQNPLTHPRFPDSIFYFTAHENNVWELGRPAGIRKVYPNEPPPSDTADPDALTPDGYLKYYEYEFTIENLLPTIPYWINVTAFDYGSPKIDVPALETSKTFGIHSVYPYADKAQSDSTLPPVYIYPNPYRFDAHYRDNGFEGRTSSRIDDRERRIHFVNVPPVCTIRIHSIDGDLIRELRHNEDSSDPNSHYATWDLINRNVQAVVSGLYYWTVESTDGSVQMGKLVVIQ